MAKSLFLMIISSLMGVAFAPEFLTAADSVQLTRIDTSGVVETVPLPEEPELNTATEPAVASAPVVSTPKAGVGNMASTTTLPANHISVAGRTLSIVEVADTTTESGSHVNKYGSSFLYGHNTANVFASICT